MSLLVFTLAADDEQPPSRTVAPMITAFDEAPSEQPSAPSRPKQKNITEHSGALSRGQLATRKDRDSVLQAFEAAKKEVGDWTTPPWPGAVPIITGSDGVGHVERLIPPIGYTGCGRIIQGTRSWADNTACGLCATNRRHVLTPIRVRTLRQIFARIRSLGGDGW